MEKYGTAGQATEGNIIRYMRFACWIPKATDAHWEYVIIIAFLLQQWLSESALILRYTYIACLLKFIFVCHSSLKIFRNRCWACIIQGFHGFV